MEELDSASNRIASLSCSVSIESVTVYLVDALWLSGVTHDNIRSIDVIISEHLCDIAISKARRVAEFIDCEAVAVGVDSDDRGGVVRVAEVEPDVEEFKFIWYLVYFFPMGEDGRSGCSSLSESVHSPEVFVCFFEAFNFQEYTLREEGVILVRRFEEVAVIAFG